MDILIKNEIGVTNNLKEIFKKSSNTLNEIVSNHDKYIVRLTGLLLDNTPAIDIYELLKDEFEFVNNSAYLEWLSSVLYLAYLCRRRHTDTIKEYLMDEEFLERIYIRIVLLKEGWNDKSIEKLIVKYYGLEWNKYYFIYYVYFRNIINIKKNRSIGRPKIPNKIKCYLDKYKILKNVNKMRNIYALYRDVNKLFTKEELQSIKESVNDDSIKKKLEILNKYT